MNPQQDPAQPNQGQPAVPEVVGPAPSAQDQEELQGAVQQPAKVMRIASMARQLLDELRSAPLDDAGRTRLKEIYETSVRELGEVVSGDLREELAALSLPFDEASPSDAELRVAHAQLVGWLEGLFHGIQAMLFAQQMETRQRLEEMRRRSLPSGVHPEAPGTGGTYL
jgi:hypothetical protein